MAETETASAGDGTLTQDEKTFGMLCHLLGLFVSWIGPLVIWLMKKDSSAFVDDQGKEALNFHITMFIAFAVSAALCLVFIGFLLLPVLSIAALVLTIMASVKAYSGERYRYPFAIRLLK